MCPLVLEYRIPLDLDDALDSLDDYLNRRKIPPLRVNGKMFRTRSDTEPPKGHQVSIYYVPSRLHVHLVLSCVEHWNMLLCVEHWNMLLRVEHWNMLLRVDYWNMFCMEHWNMFSVEHVLEHLIIYSYQLDLVTIFKGI